VENEETREQRKPERKVSRKKVRSIGARRKDDGKKRRQKQRQQRMAMRERITFSLVEYKNVQFKNYHSGSICTMCFIPYRISINSQASASERCKTF
jgi:hypothetical protein